MKIFWGILVGGVVAGVVLWYALFPSDQIFIVQVPGGGTLALARSGVSYNAAPDHHPTNGVSHIGPYVARLLLPSKPFKFLSLFTTDGQRGCALCAKGGAVSVSFTVPWKTEPQREAAIRAFFRARGIVPGEDYLAGNGGDPAATRLLEYPLYGDAAELTTLTQSMLRELCGVSPTEALDIDYRDH